MVRSLFYGGLLLTALAPGAGCQRQPSFHFAPVEGTVTRGGKPLAGVIVVFWGDADAGTAGSLSRSQTDVAGHYRLRTDQGDDGALVGRHYVCIIDISLLLDRTGNRNSIPDHLLKEFAASNSAKVPPHYAHRDETPLRAEVRPGPQSLDFDLP